MVRPLCCANACQSLIHPQLGAADTPYARTCKPAMMQPPSLPDPGVIFDSVMARKHAEKHPNRISSMLFYLASIIIHDLFRTDHDDYRNSKTSSYLDLAPLYGSNSAEQDKMRTFQDGKIKPDCFSEKRILAFPPGVGCLLIMFNRFHNYIVEQIALINENGQFSKAVKGALGSHAETRSQHDNDLFQTGRLINCGLYINIILIDYVRTILNLNRTNSNWQLNPRAVIKDGPALGVGNQVSAEFNLVYRWHSATSERDEKWTEGLWHEMFPGRDPKTVGEHEFVRKLGELEKELDDDPVLRPFHGLERQKDSDTFNDDTLVQILAESINDCANSFGAHSVPESMRPIEVLGIIQARTWNVASLNEFRKYFNLVPHKTFKDINPAIADELKHLYGHPDLVELYPGLVVEAAKRPETPGSGLTPSYTISRAVLSDAVALVRGDRFYTVDYHPKKLTNFGYAEASSDLTIDNGCVFYKLFLRAFPKHFKPNSVYAHYPLTIPEEMENILTELGKINVFSFEKPRRIGEPYFICSYEAINTVLTDQENFEVPTVSWAGKEAEDLMFASYGQPNAASRELVATALYIDNWEEEIKSYYEMITIKLLEEKSYRLADVNYVDIIRDVANLAHVHFYAELFSLPLKTDNRPQGVYTEHELYLLLAGIYVTNFSNPDQEHYFALRQQTREEARQLGTLVQQNVEAVKHTGFLSSLVHAISPEQTNLKSYGKQLIKRLLHTGMDVDEMVWGNIMGTLGGMIPTLGSLLSQTLEYYLHEGRAHLDAINKLAKLDTTEADTKLMHYFLEGSRLYGETGVFRAVSKETTVLDNGRPIHLQTGDEVMLNLKAASRDPKIFPDPDNVVLDRPIDSYIHLGTPPQECLGLPMMRVALTTMFKTICRLDKLRPALGPQGKVHKVRRGPKIRTANDEDGLPESWHYHSYLTENQDMYFPFPTCKWLALAFH